MHRDVAARREAARKTFAFMIFPFFSSQSTVESLRHRSAAIVIVPATVVLVRLADGSTDAGAGCTADNGALQSAAENRAQDSTAGTPDECALAGSYPALSLLIIAVVLAVALIVAVLFMSRVVILTATSTVAEAIGEMSRRTTVAIALIIPSVVLISAISAVVRALAERRQ